MILKESIWIKQKLRAIPKIESVIDVGSSTRYYRTVEQPYIDKNVFRPLRDKGVKIIYLDIEKIKGVDIVCNIASREFSVSQRYDLVLCTSMLKYVEDVKTACINISFLVKEGGYLIITAPYFCPYFTGDNMFRFSIDDLRVLFPDFDLLFADIISAEPRNILFRVLMTGYSAINAIKDKQFHILKNSIDYILGKTQKVACTMFYKRRNFKE